MARKRMHIQVATVLLLLGHASVCFCDDLVCPAPIACQATDTDCSACTQVIGCGWIVTNSFTASSSATYSCERNTPYPSCNNNLPPTVVVTQQYTFAGTDFPGAYASIILVDVTGVGLSLYGTPVVNGQVFEANQIEALTFQSSVAGVASFTYRLLTDSNAVSDICTNTIHVIDTSDPSVCSIQSSCSANSVTTSAPDSCASTCFAVKGCSWYSAMAYSTGTTTATTSGGAGSGGFNTGSGGLDKNKMKVNGVGGSKQNLVAERVKDIKRAADDLGKAHTHEQSQPLKASDSQKDIISGIEGHQQSATAFVAASGNPTQSVIKQTESIRRDPVTGATTNIRVMVIQTVTPIYEYSCDRLTPYPSCSANASITVLASQRVAFTTNDFDYQLAGFSLSSVVLVDVTYATGLSVGYAPAFNGQAIDGRSISTLTFHSSTTGVESFTYRLVSSNGGISDTCTMTIYIEDPCAGRCTGTCQTGTARGSTCTCGIAPATATCAVASGTGHCAGFSSTCVDPCSGKCTGTCQTGTASGTTCTCGIAPATATCSLTFGIGHCAGTSATCVAPKPTCNPLNITITSGSPYTFTGTEFGFGSCSTAAQLVIDSQTSGSFTNAFGFWTLAYLSVGSLRYTPASTVTLATISYRIVDNGISSLACALNVTIHQSSPPSSCSSSCAAAPACHTTSCYSLFGIPICTYPTMPDGTACTTFGLNGNCFLGACIAHFDHKFGAQAVSDGATTGIESTVANKPSAWSLWNTIGVVVPVCAIVGAALVIGIVLYRRQHQSTGKTADTASPL